MANPVSLGGVYTTDWPFTQPLASDVAVSESTEGSNKCLFADITTLDNNVVNRYQEDAGHKGEMLTFGQAAACCLREKWLDPQGTVFQRVDLTGDFFCQELVEACAVYGGKISHLKLSSFNIPYWKGGALMSMLEKMAGLESLCIEKCNINEELSLAWLPNLKSLRMIDCSFLHQPPTLPAGNVLETLEMLRCEALAFAPDLTHSAHLKQVRLAVCDKIVSAPSVPEGSRLEELDLWGCTDLQHIPPITDAPHLKVIKLGRCIRLAEDPVIPKGSQVQVLR